MFCLSDNAACLKLLDMCLLEGRIEVQGFFPILYCIHPKAKVVRTSMTDGPKLHSFPVKNICSVSPKVVTNPVSLKKSGLLGMVLVDLEIFFGSRAMYLF